MYSWLRPVGTDSGKRDRRITKSRRTGGCPNEYTVAGPRYDLLHGRERVYGCPLCTVCESRQPAEEEHKPLTVALGRNVSRNGERELVENVGEDNGESPHESLADDVDMVRVVDPGAPNRVPGVKALLCSLDERDLVVRPLAEVINHLGTADDDHPLVEHRNLEHGAMILRRVQDFSGERGMLLDTAHLLVALRDDSLRVVYEVVCRDIRKQRSGWASYCRDAVKLGEYDWDEPNILKNLSRTYRVRSPSDDVDCNERC